MDLEMQLPSHSLLDFNNSLTKCVDSPIAAKSPSDEEYPLESLEITEKVNATDLELRLITSIIQTNKAQFVSLWRTLSNSDESSTVDSADVSKFLYICCTFDSVECATLLINGELGAVPLVNEFDAAGMAPLHAAAEAHAARCIELLLKKHARTDLKTRDGRGLLPLELSLSRTRMDVDWNPDDYSVEDLVVQLSEKDLTAVKLLCEKTKGIDEVAYASATEGRVIDLAALLVVAAKRVNELTFELYDGDLNSKKKATIFECLISETLSLGRTETLLGAAKRKFCPFKGETEAKRKLLVRGIQLLQLFGAVAQTGRTNKKATSPLILASQAGDEVVVELLLKSNIDINDVDDDGNSALHWCLKTFKGECPQQIKIMSLLLKHGARVNHKNKLGLTAVHIAAGNGNAQALEVLLLGDPDCVNSKTETKETPLFFAVKKDSKDCAELLLHHGASTEVFNLRKQRPIDLAESQDMRFLLNTTNISPTTRSFSVQKFTAVIQGDKVISETKKIFTIIREGNSPDRTGSSAKREICRYHGSPTGCVRGSKCFYVHAGEELRQIKKATEIIHLPAARDLERKIFVGGLPLSLDSDLLRKLFEEKFGLVEHATVIGGQLGDTAQSRGFGFVTFKHKKSVSAAVEAHYITIMDKQLEIKSAIPKCLLLSDSHSSLHLQGEIDQDLAQEQTPTEEIGDWQLVTRKTKISPQISSEKTETEMPRHKTIEEAKSKHMSWVDTLICGQPKASSNNSQTLKESGPKWLRIFKKWLPNFLQHIAKKDGEYALSSLKSDFRAAFGLELDHVSLGFLKLSDFMRSFPDLCHIKFLPVGRQNHMILLPKFPKPDYQPLQRPQIFSPPSCHTSDHSSNTESCDAKAFQDVSVVSTENDDLIDDSSKASHQSPEETLFYQSPEETLFHQSPEENPKETSINFNTFLKFLEPDPIFHARPWLSDDRDGSKGYTFDLRQAQQRHVALEVLARKRNSSSVFFLREFDFFDKYKASIEQGRCFGCNQLRVLWANFPCQHLIWCATCSLEIIRAVNGFEHKCVVCDIKVQKIDLISSHHLNTLIPYLANPRCENHSPSNPDYKYFLYKGEEKCSKWSMNHLMTAALGTEKDMWTQSSPTSRL
ncbi:uncharacterized protein [Euphorbia lathyris]|uniref:uncharacterized protein n=1 Tax=Euphorbia lathyris TaxID=212925 RepID=UPI0033144227